MAEQQMIPGAADVPTVTVVAAAENYLKALTEWQTWQNKMMERQGALQILMEKEEITQFEAQGHELKLVTTATTKVKVKKLSEEK